MDRTGKVPRRSRMKTTGVGCALHLPHRTKSEEGLRFLQAPVKRAGQAATQKISRISESIPGGMSERAPQRPSFLPSPLKPGMGPCPSLCRPSARRRANPRRGARLSLARRVRTPVLMSWPATEMPNPVRSRALPLTAASPVAERKLTGRTWGQRGTAPSPSCWRERTGLGLLLSPQSSRPSLGAGRSSARSAPEKVMGVRTPGTPSGAICI